MQDGRIVGRVEAARLDGDYIIATFRITDQEALEEIDAGVTDLSLGYLSHKDADGFQRGVIVDHLALVPRGRCQTCELRADADGHMDCGCQVVAVAPLVQEMHAGVQASTCQCTSRAISSPGMSEATKMDELQKQLDEAKASLETVKGELVTAQGELTAAQTKADQAELDRDNARKDADVTAKKIAEAATAAESATARADAAEGALKTATEAHEATVTEAVKAASAKAKLDADEAYSKAIGEQVTLVLKAREILGPDATIDAAKPAREIRREVIKHVDGEDVPADKVDNDDYILGMYKGALKRADVALESRKIARIETEQVRTDGVTEAEKPNALVRERDAKQSMNTRVTETWKSQKN